MRRRTRTDEEKVYAMFKSMLKTAGIRDIKSLAAEPPAGEVALCEIEAELVDFEIDLDAMLASVADDVPMADRTHGCTTPAAEPVPSALKPVSGTQPVTIRVPRRVLKQYRAASEKTGTSYQTLMNRVLERGAEELV